MKKIRKLHTRPKGFNLIEVLVAITVIGIGFLAVASMQGTSISGNNRSSYMTEATYLAQDRIEQFRSTAYAGITTAGSPQTNIDEKGIAGGIFTRSWAVVTDSPGLLMKTVTVTVTWTERGVNHSLTMTTVIAG